MDKTTNMDLDIQQKIYDLMKYAYPILDNFPKSQKFSMVQDIKRELDTILKLAITANKKKNKLPTLEKLDVELEALRVYIRLAFDLEYFKGANNYMTFSNKLTEIGKMLGGWIKSELQRNGVVQNEDDNTYICSECGKKINAKVNAFSVKNYGKALCYTCQKTIGNKL